MWSQDYRWRKLIVGICCVLFFTLASTGTWKHPNLSTPQARYGFERYLDVDEGPYAFYDSDLPMPASYLLDRCHSFHPDNAAYCGGYVDGVAHLWKWKTSCESSLPTDQSFCAGVNAARDHAEPRASSATCMPDNQRDKNYCSGFNKQLAIDRAGDAVLRLDVPDDSRLHGLGRAKLDVDLHLWGSGEFYEFVPCVLQKMTSEELVDVLLQFIREHPEQRRETTAIIMLAKALFYGVCPGPELGLQPHMEQCTKWDLRDGLFGTVNSCDQPVAVRYQIEDDPPIERRLEPGEVVSTGSTERPAWWFMTCPVGYVSTVSLFPENREAISASRYSCIEK